MNIDWDLANRALQRIGQARLPTNDTTSRSALLLRDFYLPTILEALAEVPWTSAKRRVALVEDILSENLTEYACMYPLPVDCARPLELWLQNPYFIIEGDILYTDIPGAILLYITNGRIADPANYHDTEDFPEYETLPLEVKFWEYVEANLAGKLSLSLTGKDDLYQVLRNEALLIGQLASQASRSASAAKKNGSPLWMGGVRGR